MEIIEIVLGLSAVGTVIAYLAAEVLGFPKERRRDFALTTGFICLAILLIMVLFGWVVATTS